MRGRPWVGIAAIFAFYVIFTVVVTWPFVLHSATTTIAPLGGDIDSSISMYEALRQGHQNFRPDITFFLEQFV